MNSVQQTIANILAQKYGAALVGGSKHKKRKPTAHDKKVAAYMRKHGVSLGEASHAMRGRGYDSDENEEVMGEGRYRKRRVGRPRKHRGGKSGAFGLINDEIEEILYDPVTRATNKKA